MLLLFCYLNSKIKSYSIHNKLIIFHIYLGVKKEKRNYLLNNSFFQYPTYTEMKVRMETFIF